MKFQNCIFKHFVTDAQKDGRTSRKQYAPSSFPKLVAKKLKKVTYLFFLIHKWIGHAYSKLYSKC